MTPSSKDISQGNCDEPTPRIGIVGVGGAGGNAINNMISAELAGVNFLAANTDAQALAASQAAHSLQLGAGVTSGLGSGAQVAVGQAAAEESKDDIRNWVSQCDLLFVAAGMGGGTGTGAAPVIAEIARDEGTLSVGVVTLPFDFEGPQRMRTALEGLRELEQYVDTMIVIPNQNLFAVASATTTFANAFVMADEVLHDAIRGITDLIVLPGLINLDFADVRAVITQTGRAMMGSGIANGASRAIAAAEAAIANPLLDIVSIKGAQGLLINVTGGPDMTLFEVDEAANRIRNEVGGDSLVIFGSAFDPALDGNLRVSIVATGLSVPPQPEPEPVMAAAIEHASEEPEQTSMPLPDTELEIETDRITVDFSEDETHPIPSPTIPLPQNPRPAETATAQPKPEPASDENLQSTMEEPATDEEESPEKDKPRLGWAEKFFRS